MPDVSVSVGSPTSISVAVAGSTGGVPTVTNGGSVTVTVTNTGDRGPQGEPGTTSLSNATPAAIGSSSAGTSSSASRADHSHPAVAYSGLAGVPTTFTPAAHNQAASTITGLATIATSGSASDLSAGTVPAARLPAASSSTAGAVIVGSGLAITSGVLSATSTGSGVALSDATPAALGTAAAGTSSTASRSDHVHQLPTIAYSALSGVPSTFAPSTHTHTASQISDFATESAKYGPVLSVNGMTGAVTVSGGGSGVTLSDAMPSALGTAAPGTSSNVSRADHVHQLPTISYSALSGVPSTFAPSAHTQTASTITDFATAAAAAAPVSSVNTLTGAVVLTKSSVGLSAVDNVADASKPLSTAQAAADAAVQAYAIQRIYHTGSQAASTITGLAAVATSGSASDLSAGTVSAALLPVATGTTAGVIKVGSGLQISGGVLSRGSGYDPQSAPLEPTAITNGGTYVSWNPSPGGVATKYEVQITSDGGQTYSVLAASVIGTTYNSSYTFTYLDRFRVRGINSENLVGAWGYQSGLASDGSALVYKYATTSLFPATGASGILYVATDTSRVYHYFSSVYVQLG